MCLRAAEAEVAAVGVAAAEGRAVGDLEEGRAAAVAGAAVWVAAAEGPRSPRGALETVRRRRS